MAEAPELVEGHYLYINVCNSTPMSSENRDIYYIIRSIASDDPHFTQTTFLTKRSYSDFYELRQLLVSRHGDVQVPDIPPLATPEDESSEVVIKSRMKGFQQFIDKSLAIKELRRDPCLPLFIQSFRPMAEIREEVESTVQQEDLNSNGQAGERANRDNPEAEDPIEDEHMDNSRPAGYIFDMDDFD